MKNYLLNACDMVMYAYVCCMCQVTLCLMVGLQKLNNKNKCNCQASCY